MANGLLFGLLDPFILQIGTVDPESDDQTLTVQRIPVLVASADPHEDHAIEIHDQWVMTGYEALNPRRMPIVRAGEALLDDPIVLPALLHSLPSMSQWMMAVSHRWGVNLARAGRIGTLVRSSGITSTEGDIMPLPLAVWYSHVIDEQDEVTDAFDDAWMVIAIGHEAVECAVIADGAIVHEYMWSERGLMIPYHAIREAYHATGISMTLPVLIMHHADYIAGKPQLITWFRDLIIRLQDLCAMWQDAYPQLRILVASDDPTASQYYPDEWVQAPPAAALEGMYRFVRYSLFSQEEV